MQRIFRGFLIEQVLFSPSFPLVPLPSISSAFSLAAFWVLLWSEMVKLLAFYAVRKLFLKLFFGLPMFFYLWFEFTYWCLDQKEFADKLNAKVIHESRIGSTQEFTFLILTVANPRYFWKERRGERKKRNRMFSNYLLQDITVLEFFPEAQYFISLIFLKSSPSVILL